MKEKPMSKVLVNIYNEGKLWGMKTPAYNVPIDEGLYKLFRDMGFQIEIAKPVAKTAATNTTPKETVAVHDNVTVTSFDSTSDVGATAPTIKRLCDYRTFHKKVVEVKDAYTADELEFYSNKQLLEILGNRGLTKATVGSRHENPNEPRVTDRRPDLIRKILATNKNS